MRRDALGGEVAGGGTGGAAAGALGEEDAQAEGAGAGLGELLDLAEADVGVELFALDGNGFGVGGAESQGARDSVLGELPEVGGVLGCVCGGAQWDVLKRLRPVALGNRSTRQAGGAAVRGGVEAGADGAVLGVALQLMFNVRDGAGGVALVQLQGAVALLAAELGIAIEDSVGDCFYLPERLIPTADTDATAFHFALVKLLRSDCNFGSHSLSFVMRLRVRVRFQSKGKRSSGRNSSGPCRRRSCGRA